MGTPVQPARQPDRRLTGSALCGRHLVIAWPEMRPHPLGGDVLGQEGVVALVAGARVGKLPELIRRVRTRLSHLLSWLARHQGGPGNRVEEEAGVGVGGVVEHGGGGAALDDAAGLHDEDVVAEVMHQGEVVADEDQGQA